MSLLKRRPRTSCGATPGRTAMALLIVVAARVGAARAPPSPAVRAAYEKYCLGPDEKWDSVETEIKALDDSGRTVFVEMASGGPPMQACAWALLTAARDRRVIPILSAYISNAQNDESERRGACWQAWRLGDAELLPSLISAIDSDLTAEGPMGGGVAAYAISALGGIDDERARQKLWGATEPSGP